MNLKLLLADILGLKADFFLEIVFFDILLQYYFYFEFTQKEINILLFKTKKKI